MSLICVDAVQTHARKKEFYARRVERKTQRVTEPYINVDVSLIDVHSVTPITKGKEVVARRVERKHQRVEKQAIKASVSLPGVSDVTPNIRKKDLFAKRVYRHEEIVVSPAGISGWRGSIRHVPVDARTGESSVQ